MFAVERLTGIEDQEQNVIDSINFKTFILFVVVMIIVIINTILIIAT